MKFATGYEKNISIFLWYQNLQMSQKKKVEKLDWAL